MRGVSLSGCRTVRDEPLKEQVDNPRRQRIFVDRNVRPFRTLLRRTAGRVLFGFPDKAQTAVWTL